MDNLRDATFATESGYRTPNAYSTQWTTTRSPVYGYSDGYQNGGYDSFRDSTYPASSASVAHGISSSPFRPPAAPKTIPAGEPALNHTGRPDQSYPYSPPPSYSWQQTPIASNEYGPIGSPYTSYSNDGAVRGNSGSSTSTSSGRNGFRADDALTSRNVLASPVSVGANGVGVGQETPGQCGRRQSSFSPSESIDDVNRVSPSASDTSMDSNPTRSPAPAGGLPGSSLDLGLAINHSTTMLPGRNDGGRGRPSRRGGNRDEFDGPHQLLPRPPQQYIAMQERELPHLPTNLLVQEQDSVLTQVNDRLSRCAFDFVARYQFPIPLTQDMRPVARACDREWTEWVQLLKRLATKRRIPARVLYNGQIKQFVTILENSLEMRHAARHQSRPLKDDRNILQLISAGIQVAKILKDAPAMEFLDRLYVATDLQIQERSAAAAARFRN